MTSQQAQEFLAEINDNSLSFRTVELYKCSRCFPVLYGLGNSVLFKNCVCEGWESFTRKDKAFLLSCLDAVVTRLVALGWKWKRLALWRSWANIYKTFSEKWHNKECPFIEDRLYEDPLFTGNRQAGLFQSLLEDEVGTHFPEHNLCFTWSDITECFIVEAVPKTIKCTDVWAVEETKICYVCKPYKASDGIKIKYTEISREAFYSWLDRYQIGGITCALNMADFNWDIDHDNLEL